MPHFLAAVQELQPTVLYIQGNPQTTAAGNRQWLRCLASDDSLKVLALDEFENALVQVHTSLEIRIKTFGHDQADVGEELCVMGCVFRDQGQQQRQKRRRSQGHIHSLSTRWDPNTHAQSR
jgi:hypothetical protein